MTDVTRMPIGTIFFEETRTIHLVRVVGQRDDPPGRPDRTAMRYVLANKVIGLHENEVADAIERTVNA